jgi:hypothetical protein
VRSSGTRGRSICSDLSIDGGLCQSTAERGHATHKPPHRMHGFLSADSIVAQKVVVRPSDTPGTTHRGHPGAGSHAGGRARPERAQKVGAEIDLEREVSIHPRDCDLPRGQGSGLTDSGRRGSALETDPTTTRRVRRDPLVGRYAPLDVGLAAWWTLSGLRSAGP